MFQRVEVVDAGNVSTLIPELAVIDRHKFAVSVTTVDGQRFSMGDAKDMVSARKQRHHQPAPARVQRGVAAACSPCPRDTRLLVLE